MLYSYCFSLLSKEWLEIIRKAIIRELHFFRLWNIKLILIFFLLWKAQINSNEAELLIELKM